jgi:uncharacterized protein (DUF1015 family)
MHRTLDAKDAANFVLMALTDIDDPGLLVLSTHRLVSGLHQDALNKLTGQQLARYFTVSVPDKSESHEELLQRLAQMGDVKPTLLLRTVPNTWLLSINDVGKARMKQSGHSEAWNELDVAIVHTLILEDILGLKAEDMIAGTHIRYTRDAQRALEAVQTGEVQASLILNPTRVEQICNVAIADDRMPQKSTYFYPKLITGLVMNPLW